MNILKGSATNTYTSIKYKSIEVFKNSMVTFFFRGLDINTYYIYQLSKNSRCN